MDFGIALESLLAQFGILFGSFLDRLRIILGSFWLSFWDDFEMILI